MVVGMAIIIGCSGAMHVFLIKKKALRTHRYTPQYGKTPENPEEKLLEGGGARSGEVVAVSADKFFLRISDREVQPFNIGTLQMPTVGSRVTVAFAGGRPPQAVEILPGDVPAPSPHGRSN